MAETDPASEPREIEDPAEPVRDGAMDAIRGADRAALGIDAMTRTDATVAEVDATDEPVPRREELPRTEERPWHTTLAAAGADAGVQSDVDDPDEDEGRTPPV